jgi:hypothetical protein
MRPHGEVSQHPEPQQQLRPQSRQSATALTASPADCSEGRSEGTGVDGWRAYGSVTRTDVAAMGMLWRKEM